MTSAHAPWWEISIETGNPEDIGAMLIEAGAGGIEETGPTSIRAFFCGDPAALERFTDLVTTSGGAVTGVAPVELRNWVQEAQTHWSPLPIGELEVIPVLDSGERANPTTRYPLYINPGTGFGTGHHPTTHMVLELLQDPSVRALPNHSPALDLGTGSGILALGASLLYQASVDAIEIDPLALENAARNLDLNPAAGERIALIEGDLKKARGPYPLILANIYAEVLCELESGFRNLAAPGARLLVSGIMSSLKESVLHAYSEWQLVRVMEDRGWVAILFAR